MQQSRRGLLRTMGLAAVVGAAGCNGIAGENDGETASGGDGGAATDTPSESGASAAVAAEWNAMRARLDDAYALGLAGLPADGAAVAERTFQRFEDAGGEYGAHEYLEATSEDNYGGFEGAITDLQAALSADDTAAAADAWRRAGTNLRAAQLAAVGEEATYALDVLRFGAAANNVELLAAAGHGDGAATVAGEVLTWFEDSAVHDALEAADSDAYESLEGALGSAQSAAGSSVEDVRSATTAALDAAVTGAGALTATETAAAGHLAAYQSRAWDAAVLGALGGPSTDLAHAAALTLYRARAHDAHWLSARGATDTAETMARDIFAHFEGAEAHEALEEADHEAYEGFEGGLDALATAIADGNSNGVDEALATVDENLVAGVEALASGTGAAILEAEFFRVRIRDARELYRQGQNNVAAGIAQSLFQTFERNEAGFHEAFEDADHEAYEAFESHLGSLQTAFENTDDGGVAEHGDAVLAELLGFETTVGSAAQVGAGEATYMAARGFDAAALAALDKRDRAASVAQSTFQHFEQGAGGFHEALEAADHELYESFEGNLGAIRDAANSDGDVSDAATTYNQSAVDAAYAVVAAAGGGNSDAAATVARDIFADFEGAAVHDTLEESDTETYEAFEGKLDALVAAAEDGSGVREAVGPFAATAQRGQFAVVGALDQSPVDADGSGGGSEAETELSGGPNVVSGVPDDADHVVDMQAVSFAPAELTVSVGDTVAFEHVGGEPHTVFAYEDEIPDGAAYWASGGFESQSAAESGWENGEGAVQSGESYVHTFETAGTHGYYCAPHEAAEMVGAIVVEE